VTSPRAGRHDARPASPVQHQAERRRELPRSQADLSILITLSHAAQRAGAEPALLAAMAWRESRLDPLASNSRSSARGLMQFTEATWLEAIRDHGAAHGLAGEARGLSTDRRTGRISAPNARELGRLLDLRFDPHLSAALAAARMAAARTTLEAALARPVTSVDLYAVHLLGMAGARRFLAAHAGHRAADAVGSQVASLNRGVFFDEGGRAREVREVREAITRSTATGALLLAAVASPAPLHRNALAGAADMLR
jgi:hypothetical protein